VIYEGVSDEPKRFFGPNAITNMYMPTIEAFFGISRKLYQPEVNNILDHMGIYFPDSFKRYITFLESSEEVKIFQSKFGQSSKIALMMMKVFKELIQFRSTHWTILKLYVIKHVGTKKGTSGGNTLIFLSDPLICLFRK